MKCATCKHWRPVGTTHAPYRLTRDLGIKIVPPGDMGECHAGPPATDHTWPVTHADENCGQWTAKEAQHLDAGRTAEPADPGPAASPSTAQPARPASSRKPRKEAGHE